MNKRWWYFILIIINIPLGLATRYFPAYFTPLLRIYGGDTFYASCAFFTIRFLFTKPKLWKIALINYLFCISIETSQLYQAPWIQRLRHTPPFGLLLGYGFLWSDWICYAAGTVLAFMIAFYVEKMVSSSSK
jgi:hypothetical protein